MIRDARMMHDRYLPHHTFVAEQYRPDAKPLAVHHLLNVSQWKPPWNLHGRWTSANRDGALMYN